MKPSEIILSEAAELLGVTRSRVQALIRQGQLAARREPVPMGRGYVLVVQRAAVEALREERGRRAAGERPAGMTGPAPHTAKQTP